MSKLRWDPTFDTHERDPLADGGSARASRKAHKDERKLRSKEILNEEGYAHGATTRDGDDDTTFMDLGWVEYVIRIGRGELDPTTKKVELNIVDARARASAFHAEIGEEPSMRTRQFVAAAPFVARLGDPTVHGSPLGPGLGSTNVLVGGMPAFRAVIDTHVCPLASPIPHGGGVVAVGAPTVLVNGFPIARAGDVIIEASGGPNPIAYGSLTVWAGPLAPPVDVTEPAIEEPCDSWICIENSRARFDGLYAELQAKAGVSGQEGAGGPNLRVKAEAQAALLRAEGQSGVRVRIPGFDSVLRVGGRGSLGLGCLGGDAELEIGADGEKKIRPRGLYGARPICGDFEGDHTFEDDPLEE